MIEIKYEAMAEELAVAIEKGEEKPVPARVAPRQITANGDFGFVFSTDLLGLKYLKPSQVALKTEG